MHLMRKDVMKLIAWFLAVAHQHGHHVDINLEGWVAWPLNVSFSCHFHHWFWQVVLFRLNVFKITGMTVVWVLATILAIVHGRHVTGMHERDVDNMWYYLLTIVFALPMMSWCSPISIIHISILPTKTRANGKHKQWRRQMMSVHQQSFVGLKFYFAASTTLIYALLMIS